MSCPATAVDPNQAAYSALESRLGGDIARALAAEQKLSATLDQFAATEQLLTDEVTQEETVIANLEDQIAKLDTQIADTQARIDVEKEQLSAMSRAIYRQPDSFWLLIARSGNLREALIATADAVVAGQRAHALQTRLEADLAKLQADRQARQADLDRENGTLELLNANLSALQDVMYRQTDVSSQLSDLVGSIQDAKNRLQNVTPDETNSLALLLEAQEADLIQRSYETAWSQAQVGEGHVFEDGTQAGAYAHPHALQGHRAAGEFEVLGSHTLHVGQGPFDRPDDVRHRDLGRGARQPVTAFGPAPATDEP